MPVFVLVSLLSFVCNSALIFVILKHKPRRWEHNTFVLFLLGAFVKAMRRAAPPELEATAR